MNIELDRIATEYWDFVLSTSPTDALLLGDHRFDDQTERVSRQHEDQQITRLDGFVAAAEAIPSDGLSKDDQVTRAVLIEEAAGRANELRSRTAEFDVSPSWGFHILFPQISGQLPLTEPEHAESLVTKWSRIGDTFDDLIHRLRQGVAKDRTPPRTSVEKSIVQIGQYLASDLLTDPFVTVPPPPQFDETQTAAWREKLTQQVREVIRPAYARYRDELEGEVLAKSRPEEKTGVRWLPDGEEVYARAIRRHTSLDLAPLEIHNIGLEEIGRLEEEYRELGSQVLGTSDLDEIYERLRNDPNLRFETGEQVVAAAQSAMDRARAAIPNWFGRLPVADCVMREVPEAGAADAPIAYYLPPATDGSRPGTYFINATEPTTRTRFEAEALAFHESIPGHHLQLAIAQELEGIPEFRKHALVTVYVEGWGLYTERLADEMGLYSGPLERMGMLSFDSWRAGRLVVDTGIHALGWSKQEAIDYLVANSPQALNNIENEVERYIGMPGQALAYMIGRREIMRLRTEAETTMGLGFDIKGFHDTVLDSGPVPLSVLRSLVDDWAKA
ncbi:MAG: DUF885 domain-containing protein [Acidimicrobiia bacterium]|nr:DUF885 domain-containing protein [Acidimicrobiia bacterium]